MKKLFVAILTSIMLLNINNLFAETKIAEVAAPIIKKAEEAAKVDKLRGIKNISYKMKMEVPEANISGEIEIIATKNKSYMKTTMAGQVQEAGYNGTIAWGKDMMQGIRELAGQEKENAIQMTTEYLTDYKKYFDEIQLGKDEKFNNKDCHSLICKKSGISDKTMFIDKTSFVIVGAQEEQDSPQGKMMVKTTFDSYKTTAQGFTMPEKITVDMSVMKVSISMSGFEIDKAIDEKIFDKPTK